MKSDLTIEELVVGYNQGDLSANDLAVAEWKLANDPTFANAVEMDAMVNEVVLGNALADVRQQMTNDLSNLEHVRKTKIKVGLTAAGLLLVGSLLTVGLWDTDKKSDQPKQEIKATEKITQQAPTTITTKEEMVAKGEKDKGVSTSKSLTKIETPVKTETNKSVKKTADPVRQTEQIEVIEEKQQKVVIEQQLQTPEKVIKEKPVCNLDFTFKTIASCSGSQ